jgi:hypothetical protein
LLVLYDGLRLSLGFYDGSEESVAWLGLYDGSEAVAWLVRRLGGGVAWLGLYDAWRLLLGWYDGSEEAVAWLVLVQRSEAVAWRVFVNERIDALGLLMILSPS